MKIKIKLLFISLTISCIRYTQKQLSRGISCDDLRKFESVCNILDSYSLLLQIWKNEKIARNMLFESLYKQ